MYIWIEDVEKFKKALDEGRKEWDENNEEIGGSIIDTEDSIGEISVDDEEMSVEIINKFGSFYTKFPTDNRIEDILKVAIRKMNKIKNLIETLK